MTSILETNYIEPKRPYSNNELIFMRNKMYKKFRLGKTRAYHRRCNHFYLVKENGRKEKEILENDSCDIGNCSLCWKLTKTPRPLKEAAKNLINIYSENFYEEPTCLTYSKLDIEICFYKWLYEEQYK
jgi:hypothetical protein